MSAMLDAFLKRLAGYLALTSLVLDGHVGHRNALPIARQSNLHLISKLRCAAAPDFPLSGPTLGGVLIASMATRWLRQPPGAIPSRAYCGGTSRPACTRCNCSTRSVHNQ